MPSQPNPDSPYLESRVNRLLGQRMPGTPSTAGKVGAVHPGRVSYPAPPGLQTGAPGRPPASPGPTPGAGPPTSSSTAPVTSQPAPGAGSRKPAMKRRARNMALGQRWGGTAAQPEQQPPSQPGQGDQWPTFTPPEGFDPATQAGFTPQQPANPMAGTPYEGIAEGSQYYDPNKTVQGQGGGQAFAGLQMSRPPKPGEAPPGVEVSTPAGISRQNPTTGEDTLRLSEQGKQDYRVKKAALRKKLGPMPGLLRSPGMPELPIELGQWNYNPFTGRMEKG